MKSSPDEEIVVLAITDRALRSLWAARLGLAGEILLIVDNLDDLVLDPKTRAGATLITDTGAARVAPVQRVAAIREQGWRNDVILLVCKPHPDLDDPRTSIALRNSETEKVIALLRYGRKQVA